MPCREILTLQFGHYANFVGTHWWNIQESGFSYDGTISDIDHDIMFREGVTGHNQVTFTPRLLLVDLKGSLKSLPKEGDLYEPQQNQSDLNIEWNKELVEVKKQEGEEKNEFQNDLEQPETSTRVLNKKYNLDEKVNVWSDFLYSRFHPRTVNIVNEYQHLNEHTPFDVFTLGTSLWKNSQFEDFADTIRNYMEECDHPQGFHILTDCTNAFSGLSAACLEHLRDEYDRKSVLVLPVIPSHFSDNDFETDNQRHQSILNDSIRVINLALAFDNYRRLGSMFVPLCTGKDGWRQPGEPRKFHHSRYNHRLPYHSSAVLASALDTITLKYRLKSTNFSVADICSDLTGHGRKAVAASVCFPFSFNLDADFVECLDKWEGPLSKSLTPRCETGTDRQMQHLTIRGIPESRLKKPSNKAESQKDLPAYKCNTVKEMLEFYLSCTTYATASNVSTSEIPMPVKTPFPNIFDEFVGYNGNVIGVPRPEDIKVDAIPILAGLHSGSEIGDMIESLHTETRKLKIRRFHQFNIESDEFEECLDGLFELRENYEDSYLV